MRIDSAVVGMESKRIFMSAKSKDSAFTEIAGVKKSTDEEFEDTWKELKSRCLEYLMRIFYHGRYDSVMDSGNYNMAQTNYRSFYQNEVWEETESTSFSAEGKVVTSDGRELSFSMEVAMTRSFRYEQEIEFEQLLSTMYDPLVINMDTSVAKLENQKFLFDLDSDGVKDSISGLQKGSGFLALDKNKDGVINNGKELFGTESGNGFRDLAAYDEDKNGWIDENDSVWEKLKIWSKDEKGNDVLYQLKEKGVGAICLNYAPTQFSLNARTTNATKGMIRSTGVFLYENGGSGTIQHVDLVKHQEA